MRDRTRAGLATARRRGKRLGRPPTLRAADRARVHRLRRAGRGVRALAEVLGIARSTIARELRNGAANGSPDTLEHAAVLWFTHSFDLGKGVGEQVPESGGP